MKLEDIAKQSGVSRSTVSRVVNGDNHVSAKTRARVMAVIEAVGYTPNPAARMLVTQRSQVIGVMMPNLPGFVFDDSFYYPTLLRGISDATNRHDYGMLLWMGEAEEDSALFNRRVLKNRLMDGLVLSSAEFGTPLIPQLLDFKTTFVNLEYPGAEFEDRVSYVTVDNVQASYDAVAYLISLGRRRIAAITGTLNNIDAVHRLRGYQLALEANGIAYDESLVQSGRFTRSGGYEAMQSLVACAPDAVFVSTDEMAFGALHALLHLGIHVPDDVAIIGFDDLPIAQELTPSLTTIRQPILEKGKVAADLLIRLIEGEVSEPQHILLPTQLIIRESCGGTPASESC